MRANDYKATIALQHNEVPVALDKETGNLREIKHKKSNIPEGKEVFEAKAQFQKTYTKSWIFLKQELNPFEFKIAFELALMAKAYTNSLEPLNDDTTVNQLALFFDISRNKVTPTLKKLHNLGVYGKFEVIEVGITYTKYWILNPYLSFNGQLIDSGIAKLFKNTVIAREFHK